jgi:hypothetical protein
VFYHYLIKFSSLRLQKFLTLKSSFDGDKNKTNHCNHELNCKILCKIEPSQCTLKKCVLKLFMTNKKGLQNRQNVFNMYLFLKYS